MTVAPSLQCLRSKDLRSKFCKDKQNWIDLLKVWLIWNSVSISILFNLKLMIKTMCNLVILRSWSGDPLNSVFDWVNLKSHLAISFNQNLKLFFLITGFEPFFFFWEFPSGRVFLIFFQTEIILAARLTWDSIWRSPFTRTKVSM